MDSNFNTGAGVTYWSLIPIEELPKEKVKALRKFKNKKKVDNHDVFGYVQTRKVLPLYECFNLCLIGSKETYKSAMEEEKRCRTKGM